MQSISVRENKLKRWCHILYQWELSKWPGEIPYEDLSKLITWKLQKQVYYSELTVKELLLNLIKIYISNPIKEFWFCLHYYKTKNGLIKNSLTHQPYYIHRSKGLYMHLQESCKSDCKFCKKSQITYLTNSGIEKSLKFNSLIKKLWR